MEQTKGFAERNARGEEIIRALGSKFLANYYTLGRYDFVIIIDLPSEEAMVKLLLEVGKWGTISTETLTGMPPELMIEWQRGYDRSSEI
ncbi:GYD domain-containing protein [Methanosarcina sp. DH2]|uniref:GYD domain-containing protein n=1 Tax=Methanosarcina sp. DH2 TaxID=2605639 RepID=UPI0031F714B1|nr:GYD domain-containing protein [Methanosarcina sp. DH2]